MKRVVVNKALIRILCFFVIGLLFINFVGSIQLTSEQTAWYNSQSPETKERISKLSSEVYKELWEQKDNTARDKFIQELGLVDKSNDPSSSANSQTIPSGDLPETTKKISVLDVKSQFENFGNFLKEQKKNIDELGKSGLVGLVILYFIKWVITLLSNIWIIGDVFKTNGIVFLDFLYLLFALTFFRILYWFFRKFSFLSGIIQFFSKHLNGYFVLLITKHIYLFYLMLIAFYFLAFSVNIGIVTPDMWVNSKVSVKTDVSPTQTIMGFVLRLFFGVPIAPLVLNVPSFGSGIILLISVFLGFLFKLGLLILWLYLYVVFFSAIARKDIPKEFLINLKGFILRFIRRIILVFYYIFLAGPAWGIKKFKKVLIRIELMKAKHLLVRAAFLDTSNNMGDKLSSNNKKKKAYKIIRDIQNICQSNDDMFIYNEIFSKVFS